MTTLPEIILIFLVAVFGLAFAIELFYQWRGIRSLRFQFSLRTLFLVTGVCGILAAMSGRIFELNRKDQDVEKSVEIAATIEKEFGARTVSCGRLHKPADVYVDLRNVQITPAVMNRIGGFPQIGWLILPSGQVADAELGPVSNLTELQRLSLGGTRVSDAGLAHLKGLTKLEALALSKTGLTDAGLSYLKGLTQLRELRLDDTQVTDAGLSNFTGMTQLEELQLVGTRVTKAGVAKLQQALPNCEIVH